MCLQCGNIGPVGIVVCRELLSHTSAIPILSPFYAIPILFLASLFQISSGNTILNYKEDTYLVKWVGYKDPTWEPTNNLDHCQKMIWNVTQWQIWEGLITLQWRNVIFRLRVTPCNTHKQACTTHSQYHTDCPSCVV